MTVDVEELKVLRRAVVAAPGDVDLRLRLIARFLEAERPQDAWHQCIRVLNQEPLNVEALRLAHQAATEAGSPRRAEEYAERLAELAVQPRPERAPLRLIRGGRKGNGDSSPPVR